MNISSSQFAKLKSQQNSPRNRSRISYKNMPKKILLGCIIGVLSSATQSIGLTLQRKSHIQHEQQDLGPQQTVYKRPLWRIGFTLFLIANLLGSSVQITTLPLIILSPLQAIGLVFNSLCACILLDEEFNLETILSMISIGIGALLIAYFGSDTNDDKDWKLTELIKLLKRRNFLIWFILSISIVVLLIVYLNIVKVIRKRRRLQNKWFLTELSIENFKVIKGCSYGIISGTLSAHSLLFAKISVEIIISSINNGYSNLRDFKSLLIIVSFLSLALIQLFFLNQGLKNISTSILYPLVFCTYNIINITNGLIFYDKLKDLLFSQLLMILIGTILLLFGVFTLSWRLKDENNENSSNIERIKHSKRNSDTSFLNDNNFDENDIGYISFQSPSKIGEINSLNSEEFGKYGSLLNDNRFPKGRSKRVLSYEQNELLLQLNESDV